MKYKHIINVIPHDAPLFIRMAAQCCSSVLCRVRNDDFFYEYRYILPLYNRRSDKPYIDTNHDQWAWAQPVTEEKEIKEAVHHGTH